MLINNISLQNFRSFQKKSFEFDEKTTVIVGPNASGKTNILEAIYLLSTGKSFRAGREEEMIRNGDDVGRVMGLVVGSEQVKLEVVLTRGQINGERVARKKLTINGVGKHLYNFAGTLKIVLFGPWDLGLVTESPSTRRRFLDNVLSQVDREYRRSILSYEKGVRQRNRLLEHIRDGETSRSQLLFWDKLLIRNGTYITAAREKFIEFVNQREPLGEEIFSITYDKSAISEGRLEQYAEEEVAAATTLVGPHRDDFQFESIKGGKSTKSIKSRNLATYGSRGEQRMGVLWIKLAELSYIEGVTNERPVLLLDDIFSELDHEHREVVMGVVGQQQTLITTADPHTIEDWKKDAQIVEL
ncbi:MAG: DNA replication and repair protein RecF [bacterium]|nr:DNA replication and repair protein RecF [bacterium]